MSKKSKKRNKKYTGWDASSDDSTVNIHKVNAVPRSNTGQWFVDHKKLVRNIVIAVAIIAVIVLVFAVAL